MYAFEDNTLTVLAPDERAVTELPDSPSQRLNITLRPVEESSVKSPKDTVPPNGFINKLKRTVSSREYLLSVTKHLSVPNLKHTDEIEIHTDKRELENGCAYLFCEAVCNGYRIPAVSAEVNGREAVTEEFYRLEKRDCFRLFWIFLITSFIIEGGIGLLALAIVILIFDAELAGMILGFLGFILAITAVGELTDTLKDIRKLPIRKYTSLPYLLNELNKNI